MIVDYILQILNRNIRTQIMINPRNLWTSGIIIFESVKKCEAFFPVKVMSAVFKKYYFEELKVLHEASKLEYHGFAEKLKIPYSFKELLNTLYSKEWIVYTKKSFNGAMSVIDYLGRCTHRIAISNNRIEKIECNQIIYKAKDYKNGGKIIP